MSEWNCVGLSGTSPAKLLCRAEELGLCFLQDE